jgi:hypothetical protein
VIEELIMRYSWVVKIVAFLLLVVIFIAGFGAAVWQLWNLLMPQIFGLPNIGFWQAVGLLSLSWILFGSWRGLAFGRGRAHSGMRERWARMSPQERERFRNGMRGRCGRGSSETGSNAASV